jgi:hypothetical protein
LAPAFLVPETTVHGNGESAAVSIGTPRPDALLVTVGVTKIVEQESLLVSIQGSTDGATWFPHPLAVFPQKFYTGISTMVIDLAAHPEVAQLRAQWKTTRWGRGDKTPSFTFYVFAEPA